FALTDPDNRADVDFTRRTALLAALERHPIDRALARELVARPEDGRVKLHTIRRALALRRGVPDVFGGAYVPLDRGHGAPRHVVPFARTAGRRAAVTVVPRLALSLALGRPDPPVGRSLWRDTALRVPAALANRRFANVLTGETVETRGALLRIA